MRLKTVMLIVMLVLPILSTPLVTKAQPPAQLRRIGVLSPGALPAPSASSPFVQELRDLGYVEGQHIAFVYRSAQGNLDRLPDLAAELVRLPVDLLVAGGSAALAAKHATTTIPIVFIHTAK